MLGQLNSGDEANLLVPVYNTWEIASAILIVSADTLAYAEITVNGNQIFAQTFFDEGLTFLATGTAGLSNASITVGFDDAIHVAYTDGDSAGRCSYVISGYDWGPINGT